MVIPSSLRRDMKQKLHASHLGVELCLRRARETIFWPGMSNEIKEMVATCETCRKYERSNQKEPLMPHEIPSPPWEQVGDRPLKKHHLNQHRPKAEEPSPKSPTFTADERSTREHMDYN